VLSPDAAPPLASEQAGSTRLAIIVPCYNEAESLDKLVAALATAQTALADYSVELVLVDDGSSDETCRLLEERYAGREDVRLVRHSVNRGIAAAIETGLASSDADVVASIDADCTYDPAQLAVLVPLLTPGVDLVVASPYHPQGRVRGVSSWRLAISKLASRMYRLFLRNKLHTYTSCFRVYRPSAVRDLRVANPRFVGVVELVWLVDRRGGRIVECPAVLTTRATGQSKMRVVRTGLAHLRFLTRVALTRLFSPRPTAAASQPLLTGSPVSPSSFSP
jgi:dolichol-phosphate mannosyltransferase